MIDDEIIRERRRIAFRLCGFFIPISEIAVGTGMSEHEVLEIKHKRETYYNHKVNTDTSFLLCGKFRYMNLEEVERWEKENDRASTD